MTIQNEISLLKFIINLSNEHLSYYPDSLEDDILILEKEKINLTFNEKNILQMRISEKRILSFLHKFATYVLSLFELSSKEIKKKIKKDYPVECEYEAYINDVVLSLVRLHSSNINLNK